MLVFVSQKTYKFSGLNWAFSGPFSSPKSFRNFQLLETQPRAHKTSDNLA